MAHFQQLAGAELLLYPTAIGSEPGDPEPDSRGHWRRIMQGHAAANVMPVVASNRIGEETAGGDASLWITFYGHSFICDHTGELCQEASDQDEAILIQTFDLDEIAAYRHAWGVFHDRRPELYGDITTHTPSPR